MKRQLIPLTLLFITLACNIPPGGEKGPTFELTARPTLADQPPTPRGRCGDGVCDTKEQANPSLCPADCAAETVPPASPPPEVIGIPTFEPGEETGTYWVTNSTSGARLLVLVIRPSDWSGGGLPTLVLVPGGTGFSSGFLKPPHSTAETLAAAGFIVVLFDPDGRGQSEGVEDQDGFIHQDGLAAVIQFAATLPEVDAAQIGLVSISYGVTMATGTLARHPDLPVRFLIDWEGPANRDDTGGCDADHLGHLYGVVSCDDEAFWAEREAATFALYLPVPYLRLQSEKDHVQPDNLHALLMINNATAKTYGGNGIAPWTRLNDLTPNTVYSFTNPPTMLPESADQQLTELIIEYAQQLFALP
jgi:pimeloyl-ACP methyl ester carboxylesterase